ncbi:unnamed protein product [Polarella glacialis]|uniref:Uncharacterized protein n=1 Tax=Polarella glacialis TaxID=89957 RepID=A0A813FC55_POLGL|nr:unnamed protein product [Polarella glacialis]
MGEFRGMTAAKAQAEAGMELFKSAEGGPRELDVAAAELYKTQMEQRIFVLEAEAALLTGKDNKKERATKGKEVSELKGEARYVDACKVAKGLEPKHGNFVKEQAPQPTFKVEDAPAAAVPEKKKEVAKKTKKEEGGLTAAETQELEKVKQDIIDRKTQLKAEGLSGGQQNKDPQVVEWVNRMAVLKQKQDPGGAEEKKDKDASKKKSSKAPLSKDEQKDLGQRELEVEQYKHKLKTEFGYSKKEMLADPDLQEMEAKLTELHKRAS